MIEAWLKADLFSGAFLAFQNPTDIVSEMKHTQENGVLSRWTTSTTARGVLIAMGAGAMGWQAALYANHHPIPPGQSIANTWMAQFTVLAAPSGEPKSPDDVVIAAQITLLAQTLGLALHHSQVSDEQWKHIEPRLRTSVALMPEKAKDNMQALVGCILAAQSAGSMDAQCVRQAARLPFF